MTEENNNTKSSWKSNPPGNDSYSVNEHRLEYAWKWFDFHAKQRTTMFNFFLIALGVILAALAKFIEINNPVLVYAMSVFGIIISIIFLGFNFRNRVLVHKGEDVLRRLESEFLFAGEKIIDSMTGNEIDAGFLQGTDRTTFWETFKLLLHPKENFSTITKHRFLIPLTYLLFMIACIILPILYSIFRDSVHHFIRR